MRHVEGRHFRQIPAAHALGGRLVLLFLASLIASCGSSGDTPVPMAPPLGNDASLASLSLDGVNLEPAFSSSVTDYTAVVDYLKTSTQATATATDANANLTVNGTAVASGAASDPIALDVGSNTITANVTAEGGTTTESYIIVVTRQGAETDASLASLSVDGATLNPSFDPLVIEYTASLPWGREKADINATTNNHDASVMINGAATRSAPLNVGENTVIILVTAADGTTTRAYTIIITRENLGPTWDYDSLIGLELSNGVLAPPFSPYRFDYTATVPSSTTDINVNATPLQDATPFWGNPSITINGATTTNVPLAIGDNLIVVLVSWENGTTTRPYTVVVTRPAPDNAYLGSLELLTVATWDPPFNASQFDCTATVGHFTTSVQVAPTGEDADATIRVNGNTVASGTSSARIALSEGSNAITLNVASADNTVARTYTVTVKRQSALALAQKAYAKASNTDDEDNFGSSVSLSGSGTTLAVGAPKEDSAATGVNGDETNNGEYDSGAVYIYARDSAGTWAQQAYVKSSENEALGWCANTPDCYDDIDLFGSSVALSRDGATLAVGAPREGGYSYGDYFWFDVPTGAVHVFTRDGDGLWTQQSVLKPQESDTYPYIRPELFGARVVLSGDGETLAASNAHYPSGAVYLFARDSDLWTQQTYIEPPLVPLASCERHLVCPAVSFTLSDDGATLALSEVDGTIAIFSRDSNDVWSQSASLRLSSALRIESCVRATHQAVSTRCHLQEFPIALSADGGTLAAGDPEDRRVTIFDHGSDGVWNQRAYATASIADAADGFGGSVALSADGTILAVGALGEDSAATGIDGDETDNNAAQSGAVYLFARDGDGFWNTRTYVKASNTNAEDAFSASVALSANGGTLVVASPGEDSATAGVDGDQTDNSAENSGAAYTFELQNTP